MPEIELRGCRPTPLASYLKALAVLRSLTEQGADPAAAARWRHGRFVLRTQLSWEEIREFFLHRYEPTPLIAPWNGGSSFYPKDNKKGIDALRNTEAERFRLYRSAIELGHALLEERGLSEKPKDEEKASLLLLLRNRASEPLLRWIDAAVVLLEDRLQFPPLLGSGGNDGHLDFTNNFMQRLGDVFDIRTGNPHPESAPLLESSLRGSPSPGLASARSVSSRLGTQEGRTPPLGSRVSVINPWDFVFVLEGSVLFTASATRRLEVAEPAVLSAPFTVRSRVGSARGGALSDDNDSRGEIWLPLWPAPLTLAEVTTLFSEGRAALGRRPARDGLDFARAVARLGVDRGISELQRFAFLMRSGKAYLAAPVSRVAVRRIVQADLIDDLDRRNWLAELQRYARSEDAPASLKLLAREEGGFCPFGRHVVSGVRVEGVFG